MESLSIQLQDLAIGYRHRHGKQHCVASALNAVAQPGSLTCLIGRNGAGKSTLLRTMARLQPCLKGNVLLGGQSIDCCSASDFARMVSIVLTERPDLQQITVSELVAMGRAPYTGFWGALDQTDRDIVAMAMHSVGIEPMANRRAATLSDGEMQKVMIAKSIAQQTPVILLDEPTAFLDFPAKIDLLLLLRSIARNEHKTVLLSTHDLETALQTADTMWLLDSRGISVGTPRELAHSGEVESYVGRSDVTLDVESLTVRISR